MTELIVIAEKNNTYLICEYQVLYLSPHDVIDEEGITNDAKEQFYETYPVSNNKLVNVYNFVLNQ